jgi:hypothetical protein
MKTACYGLAVLCFLVAGACDFWQHHPKEGTVAWLFALSNALIFFWRTPN